MKNSFRPRTGKTFFKNLYDSVNPCSSLAPQNPAVKQKQILDKIWKENHSQRSLQILYCIDENDAYYLDLAKERGATCWLNALPMKGYSLI